jgi:YVTN family beta-propeller protein
MGQRTIKHILLLSLLCNCTKDKGVLLEQSDYPEPVAEIILNNCAVAGCHNTMSKDAAGGISMATWQSLFLGGRSGPVIIPYRPDFSPLCFYTNAFGDPGPSLLPVMPPAPRALSKEQFINLKNWIRRGAPDATGRVAFGPQPDRSKLYITNRLCDVVTVLDAGCKLPMRYIDVGISPKQEFPVCIKVSPDGKFWYVTFLASAVMQKFETLNDTYVGSVDLGKGIWSSFDITSDSRFAFCADNSDPGAITCVDLDLMKVVTLYTHPELVYPTGVAINNHTHKVYSGTETGNYISVVDFSKPQPTMKRLVLDGTGIPSNVPANDPVTLLTDGSTGVCYVACRATKEIRLVDTSNDSVMGVVDLGVPPTSMDIDAGAGRLFVSCSDDSVSFQNNCGSVKVVDVQTSRVIKTINTGYQPNGISVSAQYGYAAVVNSNISAKGPSPHHVTGCGGRNGNVSFIDLTSLEVLSNRYELAVFPSAISLRK